MRMSLCWTGTGFYEAKITPRIEKYEQASSSLDFCNLHAYREDLLASTQCVQS